MEPIPLSDEEILKRSITEPALFEVLIDRYQEAFIRKAEKILHGREDAEDAVQEAFVRIYIAAGRFKVMEGAVFGSWAYKILINQCLTLYKKKKRLSEKIQPLDEEHEGLLADLNQLGEFENKVSIDYIASFISRLPEMASRILTLHFIQGKSHEQIAAEENISENLARVRLHRAKQALKKIMVTLF